MTPERETELRALAHSISGTVPKTARVLIECLDKIARMREEIAVKDRAIRENLQAHIEHNEAVRVRHEAELLIWKHAVEEWESAHLKIALRHDTMVDAIRYVLKHGLTEGAAELLREAVGEG